MTTAIIGATFVDIKGFSFGPYQPTGTNIGVTKFIHGGVCRNVCEDFANQGRKARFVSTLDGTGIAADVYNRLKDRGVDMKHVFDAEKGMGIWLAILDDKGELAGSISHQPNFAPMEAYIRENIDAILGDCGSVVLEMDTTPTIAKTVLDAAIRLQKPIYVVVGNMGVILKLTDYLKSLRCFICNEIEASRLFGEDLTHLTPAQMLESLPGRAAHFGMERMVVTMGAAGAVYFDNATGERGCCPAIPTHMVDSTGAGDAFLAGCVMALNEGRALGEAVRIGTKLASATIACDQSSCACIKDLFD